MGMRTLNRSGQKEVKIVGVGGAGINILNNLNIKSNMATELWAINTDSKSLVRSKISNKIQLSNDGKGMGGDSIKGWLVAKQADKLVGLVKDTDAVILLSGLGGGTGSGVTPVIAKLAKKFGIKVFAIATMPFKHEGLSRRKKAEITLGELSANVDVLKIIENETINAMKTDLSTAFGHIDMVFKTEVENFIKTIKSEKK